MIRFLLLALSACLITLASYSQKIPLIHSGDVLEKGKALYDSGQYEAAIKQFLTIPARDTNYVQMLSELALAYIGHEQYEKALTTVEEGLKTPSIYHAHLLRSGAIAMDRKGNYDEAVSMFNKAIDAYPSDHGLVFNLGITHYNHKAYDKAIDCFFKVLSINPYHAGTHLNLGRLAIGQGRKTHAMLSFGIYLGVNNMDNDRLVLLDKFLTNQVTEEGSIPAQGENACTKLDQIIRAKIALDKNFKSKIPVEAAVVRQYEMLFEQLATLPADGNDRWTRFYLSVYKTIKDKNVSEPFIYHILSSADNDQVKKWRKKNEKVLDVFFDAVNGALQEKRQWPVVSVSAGFDKPVQGWYDNNNSLVALGNKDDVQKKQGRWKYYYANRELSAEGSYENDVKKGVWKYYYDQGAVKSIEDYATGEVTVFYEDGGKHQHFFLKNDAIDGEALVYFPCGTLKEKVLYKNGKREGKATAYYASGKTEATYAYAGGNLTGEYVNYYETGQIYNKGTYHDGQLQGSYAEYYVNGKVSALGEYAADALHGVWKHHYDNGKLNRTGAYENSYGVGEWLFYDERGLIKEKRNFGAEGKLNGPDSIFHDGKLHYVQTFKNDLLIKLAYYDKEGKEIAKFGKSDGTFAAKTYYPTGQLNAEGDVKKGKNQGLWKFYYRSGKLLSEYNYVDDLEQGEAREYHHSGVNKFAFQYVDGALDGYYQEFYANGRVKEEGWYQSGKRQQQWYAYHVDGSLESDYYYLDGDLYSTCIEYNVDGKVYSSTTYNADGGITDIKNFNTKGEVKTTKRADAGSTIYEVRYSNKKLQSRYTITCGYYAGDITRWSPDGKVLQTYPILGGKRNGRYESYSLENTLVVQGQYSNGMAEGVWKGFSDNGKPDYVGKYHNDEYDSTWTYYFPYGKIASTAEYKNGKRHGVTRYHSPEGTAAVEKLYNNGDLLSYRVMGAQGSWVPWVTFTGDAVIEAYYSDGSKSYTEQYKNSLLEGAKQLFFANGKLYSEYLYKAGDYEGTYRIYYANGKLREKGTYKDDELHGSVEYYHEDGSLTKTVHYVAGVRDGKTMLYKKGVKFKEYNFWGGSIDE